MKTTGKWTLLALTPVLAAGLTAGSAFADGRGSHGEGFRRHGMRAHFSRRNHRGMRRMRHLGRMKETLGLTDDQVIKIKDIFTEARKKRTNAARYVRADRYSHSEIGAMTFVNFRRFRRTRPERRQSRTAPLRNRRRLRMIAARWFDRRRHPSSSVRGSTRCRRWRTTIPPLDRGPVARSGLAGSP